MRTATTKQQRKQFEERKKKNVVQNYLESVRNVANQETLKRRHCATICTLFCCVHFFVLLSPICIYTALHWIAHILIAWTQNWKHSNAPFLNAPKCRGRDRTEARKSSSELNRLYTCVRIFFLLFSNICEKIENVLPRNIVAAGVIYLRRSCLVIFCLFINNTVAT